MNLQLVVISGPDQGRTFPLADGQTLAIGRGQASGTQLRDPRVSRAHCHAEVDAGKARLIHSGGFADDMVHVIPKNAPRVQINFQQISPPKGVNG